MIYDRKLKTLERFDPQGVITRNNCSAGDVDPKIQKLFRENMGVSFVKEYYPPSSFVDKACWQSLESKDRKLLKIKGGRGGFCTSWSAFYADMRMSNPDLDRNELAEEIHHVLRTDMKAFPSFIRSYTAFLGKVECEYDRTGDMEKTLANIAAKCNKIQK
jgi:hypothetical protein